MSGPGRGLRGVLSRPVVIAAGVAVASVALWKYVASSSRGSNKSPKDQPGGSAVWPKQSGGPSAGSSHPASRRNAADASAEDEIDIATDTLFLAATEYAKTNSPTKMSVEDKLTLYKYYKQATLGQCNTPKPSLLEMRERAKWDAWKSAGSMGRKAARDKYLEVVAKFFPGWKEIMDAAVAKSKQAAKEAATTPSGVSAAPLDSGASSHDASSSGANAGAGAPVQSSGPGSGPALSADAMSAVLEAVQKKAAEAGPSSGGSQGGGFPSVSTLSGVADEEDETTKKDDIFWFIGTSQNDLALEALRGGADPNSVNENGETALHVACDRGLDDIVTALLDAGANPDVQETELGMTPLAYAIMSEHYTIASILIERGADIDIADHDGNYPLADCPPADRVPLMAKAAEAAKVRK